MITAIVIMFSITAMVLMVFILMNPQATPILAGQRWQMPGIGTITIMKVLGSRLSFEKDGLNVMYQLHDGSYGFCKKSDLRNFGKLLLHRRDTVKQAEIDKILREMDRKKHAFSKHTSSHNDIQDAEVIISNDVDRAIRQYKAVMSYDKEYRPKG